jgi:ketosteroid isomerase-like protein
VPVDEATVEAAARLLPSGDFVEAIDDPAYRAATIEILGRIAVPDVEVTMIGGGGMIGPFLGPEGFERAWREWLAAFARYRVEQEPEPRRSGDAVVFFARQIATPRGSDQPVTSEGALVAFFRDGKARRIEFHLDHAAALRAAGL